MVTKLKNSNCDKTQNLKMWQNSTCDKTQVVTKLKLWRNSNCDKNSSCDKTQIVTKLKLWEKTQKLKCDNSECDKTRELKLWQLKNSNYDKTLKKSNWDKSQFMNTKKKLEKALLVRTFWHLDNRWDVLWAAFCDSHNVLKYFSLGSRPRVWTGQVS